MGRPEMYRCCILLFLLGIFLSNVSAQSVNFEDGFEDGDFTQNPTWIGHTDDYIVTLGNPNYLLQLNATSESPRYLSTPSTSVVGFWEFYIAFDGFEPSGSNKAEVFLMSDISDLTGPVNGYAIKAGESGPDIFHLVRYDNGVESATVLSDTTVISSAGGGYRIRVTRENGGSWTLEVASGYEGSLPDSGISAVDNTHTVSSFFGMKTTFSSTRSDKFYYDFKIDLPPFDVVDLSASPGTIDITFNRPYDLASVQPGDFQIDNGIGSPSSIQFPDNNIIRLGFSDPLPSNRYTLNIGEIRDEFGEPLSLNTILDFIIYGTVEKGNIIINEFMYDPPPGLPEYVELKNISSKFLNIQDWQLGDQNVSEIITPNVSSFQPDTFLVISSDTLSLFQHFGPRNYLQMSSGKFPSLNNGGDAILLTNSEGEQLDSLFYTSDWGGEEVALERRSDTAPSFYAANWGDSPQGAGTPGMANLVEPDHTPPELLQISVLNSESLHLQFSEAVNKESARDISNFTITPSVDLQQVVIDESSIFLYLTNNLISGQAYQLSIQNIEDIFGNRLDSQTHAFTFLEYSETQPGDIVINEILFLRADGDGPEFIELFNTSDKNFDLSGWILGDAVGSVSLPEETFLNANGYLVLTDNTSFAHSTQPARAILGFPSLNDAGDSVFLRDPEGTTFDSLRYSSNWDEVGNGISLERRDPLAASNDPSNWAGNTAATGHTAAAQNSVYQSDESPPELIFAQALPEGIINLQFDEFIKPTQDLDFQLEGSVLKISSFDSAKGNQIKLEAPDNVIERKSINITVHNLSDVKGNVKTQSRLPVAMPLSPFDLVVNEIMYQPLSDPSDNLPDQGEYVELRNTKDFPISLQGIYISGAPDENGNTGALFPVSTQAAWIPAHGFALIYADAETKFEESRVARFFELESDNPSSVIRVDRSTLSLTSSDHALLLRDSTGTAIDSVYYDQSWHNSNIADHRGIALERIRPTGPSNDPSNWSSSTTLSGGTPGFENSIYQPEAPAPERVGITFSSNPFSPDGDGFEDHLIINYRLDETDYMMKVTIFDRYGRRIRRLADGIPSGPEGSLIWDGRKDDGSRNRIGIYIVVFEAYDSTVGRDLALKETVVLARRLN